MILYNVTVNIEPDALSEWLDWMKTVHIPDVLATGLFTEHRFFRVASTEHGEGHTYSIQYFLESMDEYEAYKTHHAPRLQKEHAERFANRYVAFRTLLESA
jgi:hypothetical protein